MIFAGLGGQNPAFLILFALAAVISIVLHEVAHALVAKWNGDYTAKFSGRISLNPVRHFDLMGFILLMTVGFGYAKPVPVNSLNFRHRRRGFFLVSIAGVTTNLILALFSSMFLVIIQRFAYADLGPPNDFAYVMTVAFECFFGFMVIVNTNLVIFNLIPVFPLDGHRVLETITGSMNRVTKFLRDLGPYILFILLLIGAVTGLIAQQLDLPPWADPLGYAIDTVGRGLGNCFNNLWRLIFGGYGGWGPRIWWGSIL